MPRDFHTAVRLLAGAEVGEELARPFLELFPVDGVSVSTVGPVLGSETLTATDGVALRLDELQFDLGEGPCWDAMRSGAATILDDVRGGADELWPSFGPAIENLGVGAMFVFPVRVGPVQLGAIDLYCAYPQSLQPDYVEQAGILAGVVSRIVMKDALLRQGRDEDAPPSVHSRRLVHQATGKVLIQAEVTAEDAHLLIQGFAFSTGRRVIDVAEDIMDGRLSFSATAEGIEEHTHE